MGKRTAEEIAARCFTVHPPPCEKCGDGWNVHEVDLEGPAPCDACDCASYVGPTVREHYQSQVAQAIRDAVKESVGTPIDQCADEQIAHVMRHRELYVEAWIAATGHRPEESVLVQQQREDGSTAMWAELKKPTCPECGEPTTTVTRCPTESCPGSNA